MLNHSTSATPPKPMDGKATAPHSTRKKKPPFVPWRLEVRIRIQRTHSPALFHVQWWSNKDTRRAGRYAQTGLQVVGNILQALRYLQNNS